MEPLILLLVISIIFFLGLISSIISNKFQIPNMLLLMLVGLLLANLPFLKIHTHPFSNITLVSTISTLALIIIVFTYTSKFRLKDFDTLSNEAGTITLFSILFSFFSIAFLVHYLLKMNYILSFIFAGALLGTDPSAVSQFIPKIKNKTLKLLFIESIINSPITVLIPITFMDIALNMPKTSVLISNFVTSLLSQIITGIGAGFVVGLIFFKFMRKSYSSSLSPLALITAAILSYVLSEFLSGNGIFAVTTLGLFYGSISLKNKFVLSEYSRVISEILEIFVFVIIGMLFDVKYLTFPFIIKLLIIFIVYLFSRWISVILALRKTTYTKFEKLFITFVCPKGVVTVVTILTIALHSLFTKEVLNLLIAFIFLSQLSSLVFAKYFSKHLKDFSRVKLKKYNYKNLNSILKEGNKNKQKQKKNIKNTEKKGSHNKISNDRKKVKNREDEIEYNKHNNLSKIIKKRIQKKKK